MTVSNTPDSMPIAPPCVVTLTWTLRDSLNDIIAKQETPTAYFYGGGDLLPKIEEALLSQQKGEQLDLYLEPDHGYGDYDSDLVFFETRSIFPEPVEPGMQFESLPTGAKNTPVDDAIYTVTEVYEDYIVLDGNHPLAGISLKLHIYIRDVRPATDEEIEKRSLATMDFEVADMLPLGQKLH